MINKSLIERKINLILDDLEKLKKFKNYSFWFFKSLTK